MDASSFALPRRVLVVEDDPPTRLALSVLLKHSGWIVIAVATVEKTLEALDARPLCIILDLMLPDGSGLNVLRHVRTNELPIRVAVATGEHDPVLLAEVAELRPDALYRKPLEADELRNWLTECAAQEQED